MREASSLERAKASLDEQYAGRLSFNLRTRPAQLELAELRPEDEGDYRCRVDFKRGRTVNTIISLRVVQPPSELSLYLLTGATRQLVASASSGQRRAPASVQQPIGPLDEGAELEVLCAVRGGRPRPQVEWRRDFQALDTQLATAKHLAARRQAQPDKEETVAVMQIGALGRQHLLSVFTCQATNNNLTAPLQSSITLDLNCKWPRGSSFDSCTRPPDFRSRTRRETNPQPPLAPLKSPVKPKEVLLRRLPSAGGLEPPGPLLAGQTATFECTSTGSRPQATIHWLFQGRRHDPPMSRKCSSRPPLAQTKHAAPSNSPTRPPLSLPRPRQSTSALAKTKNTRPAAVDQQQTSSKLSLPLQRSFNGQPLACVAENARIAAAAGAPSSGASEQTTIKLDVQCE